METKKQIGIWMDHSTAHVIEAKDSKLESKSINSEFTFQQKQQALSRNENIMHNKEQNLQAKYYESIANVLKGHNEVLLFGPTNAKVELSNILKADHHFDNIKIDILDADKMTENQQHAFVRKHFNIG
jgi:hypothetical protein